jgi:Na+(H+)/acetate symporter ActP
MMARCAAAGASSSAAPYASAAASKAPALMCAVAMAFAPSYVLASSSKGSGRGHGRGLVGGGAHSSIITDLYQNALGRMRDAPDAEVVAASKKITLVLGVFSVVLAFFLAQLIGQSLILMSAAVQGLFCGPTLGIFLLGMCSTRANAQGALLGYGAGFLVLAVLVVGQAVCSSRPDGDAACAPGGSLHRLTISEWYYGVVGCLVSVVVGYGASLRWAPPTNLEGLTFFTLEGAKGKGGKTEARSGGGDGGGGGVGNRLASAAEPLLRDD